MNTTPSRTSGAAYLWRWSTGAPLDGKPRTNATFRYRGTRDLTSHGHAGRWSHRAGWERATIRHAYTFATLAILYGFVVNAPVTIDSLYGAFAGLVIGGGIRGRYALASYRHHKRIVRPLYQAATQIVNMGTVSPHIQAYGENHKRHLRVPVNYRHPNAKIRYEVPPSWIGEPGQIRQLTNLFERRLGGDWDATPHWGAYPPHIMFTPSPQPPSKVSWKEILPSIEQGKDSQVMIGFGTRGSVIGIDLDSESPHVALSMGTGGGKSSLLRLIIIQLIRKGTERIDIIDPKRISHNWARNIPGVHIHRTMSEQMNAIAEFRKRMETRYDQLDRDDSIVFPRHVLIMEEQNSFMEYAKTYWEDYRSELGREEKAKTPKRNPAIGNLAYILFQGRQARMNIFSVFQRMSASASGGGDMRVNYGAKLLARFDSQAWMMLVGTRPVPRSSRINGRGRFVLGDEDKAVQFAFVSEADSKAYALAHAKSEPLAKSSALTDVPADGAGSDEPEPAMTLRELCEAGIVPVRYSTATRARSRAGDAFPQGEPSPIGTLYRPGPVCDWFDSRKGKR